MHATTETLNHEADLQARENVPALSRPFDYHDVGATAVSEGPWAVEQKPYEGPALEASSNANSAVMSVSALKKLCASTRVSGILHPPQIIDNTMHHPGKESQLTNIKLSFDAVDPACNGHFLRQVTIMPELVRHGHVIKELPLPMPILNSNASLITSFPGVVSRNQPKLFYQRGDKAQFVLTTTDRDTATKKIVKETTKIKPIKVKH